MRISLVALLSCIVACAAPATRTGGPGDGGLGTGPDGSVSAGADGGLGSAPDGSVSVVSDGGLGRGPDASVSVGADSGPLDSGSSCVPCHSGDLEPCDGGCEAFGTWVKAPRETLDFFVTVASECNDGGYDIAGTEAEISDGSDATGGAPDAVGSDERRVSPVICPTPKAGDCPSTTFCSWNQPETSPVVSPIGFFADGVFPPGRGAEVSGTFTVDSAGIPVSVGFVATRTNPQSLATVPADLLVDVVPTAQGMPTVDGTYIVRARLDTGLLQYDQDSPSTKARFVTLRFESNVASILQPGVTYGLYWHIESPGVDSVSIGSVPFATSSIAFTRQIQ